MRQLAPSRLARPPGAAEKANAERSQRVAVPNAHAPNEANVAVPPAAQQRQRPADTSRRTVGLTPGNAQRQPSPADRQRLQEARRVPILRNPAFAGTSSNASAAPGSRGTFRGAFAQSGFARDLHRRHDRRLGFVLGFVGPVFWPYAYTDFVDYTFSPYAYDTFWPYAFDDVYAGIFGGYAPEYYSADDVYAYAGAQASERTYARVAVRAPPATPASATQSRICSGQAQGITDFSIDKIVQQVEPDQKQQRCLIG
jgi:hypothetical protein